MDDLDRSIARRQARSPDYRARLTRELHKQSAGVGKPASPKARRVADPGALVSDGRVARKRQAAPNSGAAKGSPRPSSPVLTELSTKLSSTAEAMRAALDRRSGQ